MYGQLSELFVDERQNIIEKHGLQSKIVPKAKHFFIFFQKFANLQFSLYAILSSLKNVLSTHYSILKALKRHMKGIIKIEGVKIIKYVFGRRWHL